MNRSRRHTRIDFLRFASAVIGAGAILLSACTAAQTPGSSPAATSAASASAAGLPAGSVPTNPFTWVASSDPISLDPAAATDTPGRMNVVNMYEPLVRYEGKPAKLTPNLAESITASTDLKTYTVKLKPNIKFHDGSDLDAAAVAFSMDRTLAIKKGGAAPFAKALNPGDTKAIDKLTVQFNLRAASSIFPGTLAFFFIVNPKVVLVNKLATGPYGANGDYAEQYLQTHDAGSGPYMLTSRTPNAEVKYAAFPGYWRGWKAEQYGTFTYKIMAEPATAGLLLKQGDVDGVFETYTSTLFDTLANEPTVQIYADLGWTAFYLWMNSKRAPTDNVKVRQAIAQLFDYKTALSLIPGAVPMPGPVPVVMGGVSSGGYEYNLEKAKALLAEAGVKPGTTIGFSSVGGAANIRAKLALLLQDGLAKVGLNLAITNSAWADVVVRMSKPETADMVGLAQPSDYNDPDGLLYAGFHTDNQGTSAAPGWYSNPKVDELINQGRTTADATKRQTIYQQAQQQIIADSPAIFVGNSPVMVALKKNVGGYAFVQAGFNYQVYPLFKKS